MARYRAIRAAAPLVLAIEHLLREYGHRAFHYASEFEAVRLADQPELVLLAIGEQLKEWESPAVRADAARRTARQALARIGPLRQAIWGRLLAWGTRLLEQREENRDTLELQNAVYGLAARLLSRHHFSDQPEDTPWLYTFDEFLAFGQSRGRQRVSPLEVERRRSELQRHRQEEDPPELI